MATQQNQLDNKGRVWVTEKEVSLLMSGAKKTRHPLRNKLLVLMLYRHGLRESELCSLRISNLDFDNARVFIRRVKGGIDFTHPIAGDELRLGHDNLSMYKNMVKYCYDNEKQICNSFKN